MEVKCQSRLSNKTRQACALNKNREKHACCNVGWSIQLKNAILRRVRAIPLKKSKELENG